MKDYNPNAVCPKCGYLEIGLSYCAGGEYKERCGYTKEEHFHRHCRRCHYEWFEKCLDSKVQE